MSALTKKVLRLVRQRGVLRPRDLDRHSIPRQYLRILKGAGKIQRSGRGLYTVIDHNFTENHTIAEACKRVPHGVVCLLSALRFHGLTTQLPHEVWIAIDRRRRKPSVDYPPLRVLRFSGAAMSSRIQIRRVEGVDVHVYDPGKTVADCFKFRNKIGLDVALEALRECRRLRKASMEEIWSAAKICRVSNVMRPYLEAIE